MEWELSGVFGGGGSQRLSGRVAVGLRGRDWRLVGMELRGARLVGGGCVRVEAVAVGWGVDQLGQRAVGPFVLSLWERAVSLFALLSMSYVMGSFLFESSMRLHSLGY